MTSLLLNVPSGFDLEINYLQSAAFDSWREVRRDPIANSRLLNQHKKKAQQNNVNRGKNCKYIVQETSGKHQRGNRKSDNMRISN